MGSCYSARKNLPMIQLFYERSRTKEHRCRSVLKEFVCVDDCKSDAVSPGFMRRFSNLQQLQPRLNCFVRSKLFACVLVQVHGHQSCEHPCHIDLRDLIFLANTYEEGHGVTLVVVSRGWSDSESIAAHNSNQT